MPAAWLVGLAWVALAVAFTCSAAIVFDIHARGYRQRMRVMEVVWPVTALYAGPLATLAYRRFGGPNSHKWLAEQDRDEPPGKPWWATVAVGVSLAVGLGLVFQYLAIAPMRGLGLRKGIVVAAKADILSLAAFETGLFGWMALNSLVFFPSPHIHPDSPVCWFMMQIGMCLGFLTAYPVNMPG